MCGRLSVHLHVYMVDSISLISVEQSMLHETVRERWLPMHYARLLVYLFDLLTSSVICLAVYLYEAAHPLSYHYVYLQSYSVCPMVQRIMKID